MNSTKLSADTYEDLKVIPSFLLPPPPSSQHLDSGALPSWRKKGYGPADKPGEKRMAMERTDKEQASGELVE